MYSNILIVFLVAFKGSSGSIVFSGLPANRDDPFILEIVARDQFGQQLVSISRPVRLGNNTVQHKTASLLLIETVVPYSQLLCGVCVCVCVQDLVETVQSTL